MCRIYRLKMHGATGVPPLSDHETGIKITGRTLPFPQSVSPEAQAVLRRLVGEDGVPLNSLYVMPTEDDLDGWRTIRATADRFYSAAAEAVETSLRSTATLVPVGDTVVHVATPEAAKESSGVVIDLHGGALVSGGGTACRANARMRADQLGLPCYAIDYRMPPDHPYPAALDDCLSVYRHVLERHAAEEIILYGRSAGGNLAASTLLRARDEGLPSPAALVLLSPQVDLTESGDSFEVNRTVDVVLPGSLMRNNRLYAAGADLTHPYLSPLFGDLAGFPPTFLQSGTRDLFLSNTVRMHRALRAAGVLAELHVFEAMPHGGFMGTTPEDGELLNEIALFIRRHLQTRPG
jgi:epsilon-lactone hydrolase